MMLPPTCVPIAAGTIRAATAAAEPRGRAARRATRIERIGRRPRMRPAQLRRHRLAEHHRARVAQRPHRGVVALREIARGAAQPISVGMSLVSSRSLMPIGMPSIGESGRPACQRAAAHPPRRARRPRSARPRRAPPARAPRSSPGSAPDTRAAYRCRRGRRAWPRARPARGTLSVNSCPSPLLSQHAVPHRQAEQRRQRDHPEAGLAEHPLARQAEHPHPAEMPSQ